MKKVVLISGLAKKLPDVIDADLIGVDHGASVIAQAGVSMKAAIGDFDSVDGNELKAIAEHAETIVKLVPQKDETDTEEAIKYALEQGYDEIVIYGALGGRIDHEMANIYLLMHRRYPIMYIDDKNRVRVLKNGQYQVGNEFTYLSFLALEESCISVNGVAYPMSHRIITLKDIFSISNEITSEVCDIDIHYGRVLMMETRD